MVQIEGRYAWISGGAQGLGYCFAEALLQRGALGVCIADIVDAEKGEDVVKRLQENATDKRAKVLYSQCDVRDAERLSASMETAFEAFRGRLDVCVNNAGIGDEGDVSNHIAINLQSVIVATQIAVRIMHRSSVKPPGGACVVNVASAAGIYPFEAAPIYSACKHGVVGYSRSLKGLHRSHGVRVNVLCPAFVQTPMLDKYKSNGVVPSRLIDFMGVLDTDKVCNALLHILESEKMVGDALWMSERTGIQYPLRHQAELLRMNVASREGATSEAAKNPNAVLGGALTS